ncbi:C-type lectin domain family 4 member E [Acanthopagrus latus]|uniref:C-type lectin domain family 4 member E n=1 Tax=Acanthopagrus latus TaxID=8177 RepID=UPI00187CBBA7|nr:C-type lectin domain family 4 member E [Acanthopagrus latus]
MMMKGHAILFVLIGLLVSEAYSQAPDKSEKEVASLRLEISLLKNSYRQLCQKYRDVAANCSVPDFQCNECPDKWLHVGDQCFLMIPDRQDFATSAQKCQEMGAHLAILNNREEHDAVEKEGRRIAGFHTHYWIGLTDSETEGQWKWVDNSTITTPFWDPDKNEPDNHQSGGPEGEDCAVVNSYSQTWFDVPCSFSYPRICQMKASPIP